MDSFQDNKGFGALKTDVREKVASCFFSIAENPYIRSPACGFLSCVHLWMALLSLVPAIWVWGKVLALCVRCTKCQKTPKNSQIEKFIRDVFSPEISTRRLGTIHRPRRTCTNLLQGHRSPSAPRCNYQSCLAVIMWMPNRSCMRTWADAVIGPVNVRGLSFHQGKR